MRRGFYIWVSFIAGLAVALGAMAWLSRTAFDLERAQREAARQAALEEQVRLALWRMDSRLAALVARESARPYYHYKHTYSAAEAGLATGKSSPGLVYESPLARGGAYVILYFQLWPDGALTSPQVPRGDAETAAAKGEPGRAELAGQNIQALGKALKFAELTALLPAAPAAAALPIVATGPSAAKARYPGGSDAAAEEATQSRHVGTAAVAGQQAIVHTQAAQQRQSTLNEAEYQNRMLNVKQNVELSQRAQIEAPSMELASQVPEVMKPLWTGDMLILARRARFGDLELIQGCRLDWPALRGEMLAEIKDLLPQADLVKASGREGDGGARMLASLPVELVPGVVAASRSDGVSAIVVALVVAWAAVILGLASAGALLWGAMSLSARRGAFVSAVTHELRTPLTTFLMYTEMLEGRMVPDEKRAGYVQTLRLEAERLSHLVENVLAYSRLENNRAAGHVEEVTLTDLVERVCRRLGERAAKEGMQLVCDLGDLCSDVVMADRGAVERILFNLVDNACKYAASAADRRIHIEAGEQNGLAAITVRDHGPGIDASVARRVFRPFAKSSTEAANSAPGVGLGLSLCRRLARTLGGDLSLESPAGGGACFILTLRRR